MDDLKQKKSLKHVASYKLSKVSISSSCSFSACVVMPGLTVAVLLDKWSETQTGLLRERLPPPITRSQLEIVIIV